MTVQAMLEEGPYGGLLFSITAASVPQKIRVASLLQDEEAPVDVVASVYRLVDASAFAVGIYLATYRYVNDRKSHPALIDHWE